MPYPGRVTRKTMSRFGWIPEEAGHAEANGYGCLTGRRDGDNYQIRLSALRLARIRAASQLPSRYFFDDSGTIFDTSSPEIFIAGLAESNGLKGPGASWQGPRTALCLPSVHLRHR
jgi:hypothetical protein